ncbi:MAG: CocE/NonD family hydrolase C-terminal non-catalytic domain-containing protein, partial [Pigmentiphaga sp.]
CANWGGMGIHPRGNFSGFTDALIDDKWLEVHGDTHWSLFSAPYGLQLQKRFFDHFLKGMSNDWREQPRVLLNLRHVDGRFEARAEPEWPLARTRWTDYYLDAATGGLTLESPAPAQATYRGLGDGLTFRTEPLAQATEITGPVAARVYITSDTVDADLFLTVQVFDPQGQELTFQGALDPNTPIAMGWLRASHRCLEPERSRPWQPFHPHDREEPLAPDEIVALDIEILPTCVVLPAGWSVGLSVRGRDYEYQGEIADFGQQFYYATRGTGGMTHGEPVDRPAAMFDNSVTLYTGGNTASYLRLPIVPSHD